MSKLGVAILRRVSRPIGASDYDTGPPDADSGNESLSLLRREIQDFDSLIQGKKIVDFGCGFGRQSIEMIRSGATYVVGVETNTTSFDTAVRNRNAAAISDSKFALVPASTAEMRGSFDVVISQNSMEHFSDPSAVLMTMKDLLRDDGSLIITFGPPWYAPFGSHMHFFCRVPWINILFSEKSVMTVRNSYRSDGAKRYAEVESGLNQMSVRRFLDLVRSCGLSVHRLELRGVRNHGWLTTIPVLRELFVNHITCILRRTST